MTEVDSIRSRHRRAHANPVANPSWANAEVDLGLLLAAYDALAAEQEATLLREQALIKRNSELAAELDRIQAEAKYIIDSQADRITQLETALRKLTEACEHGHVSLALLDESKAVMTSPETKCQHDPFSATSSLTWLGSTPDINSSSFRYHCKVCDKIIDLEPTQAKTKDEGQ
jgi:hypothetical protein